MNFSKLTTPQLQAKLLLADKEQKKQIQAILDKRAAVTKAAAKNAESLTGDVELPEVDMLTKEPVKKEAKKAAPAKKAVKKSSNRGANQVPELIGKIAKFSSRNGQQPIEGEIVKAFVDQRDLKVYVGVTFKKKMYFKQKDKAEIRSKTKAELAASKEAKDLVG